MTCLSVLLQRKISTSHAAPVLEFPGKLSGISPAFVITSSTLASSTKVITQSSVGASAGAHGILSRSTRGRRRNARQSLSLRTFSVDRHSRYAVASMFHSLGTLFPGSGRMAKRLFNIIVALTLWLTCEKRERS